MGFFNEIDALKDHSLEPFQNEPGKRRFVQIVRRKAGCLGAPEFLRQETAKQNSPGSKAFGPGLSRTTKFFHPLLAAINLEILIESLSTRAFRD